MGRVDAWLAGAKAAQTGPVEIALRSEDPDDLTLREARLLGSADRVIHDPDVPVSVLNRARADAVRQSAATDSGQDDPAGLTVILRAPR